VEEDGSSEEREELCRCAYLEGFRGIEREAATARRSGVVERSGRNGAPRARGAGPTARERGLAREHARRLREEAEERGRGRGRATANAAFGGLL